MTINACQVDWDGYTIGYYGRIFEARNKTKGGSFEVLPLLQLHRVSFKDSCVFALLFFFVLLILFAIMQGDDKAFYKFRLGLQEVVDS